MLLVEGHEAYATPSISAGSTLSFSDVLVNSTAVTKGELATLTGGSGTTLTFGATSGVWGPTTAANFSSITTSPYSNTSNYTFKPTTTGVASTTVTITDSGGGNIQTVTLVGTGVAPLESISSANPYVLVGQTVSSTLTISNTGNGNLSGVGTLSNLRGTVGSGASVFVGSGGSFSLQDSSSGTGAVTSATFAYSFNPTITGAASTTIVTTLADGTNAGNVAGLVTTTLSGTGVAPIESVSSTSGGYVRVGTSGTAAVVVANTGNGNLAGSGTAYNLNASVSNALGSGFVSSNSGTVSLASNATASTSSTATSTLGYTYSPVSRGASSSVVTLNFSNGSSNDQNLSQSVAATVTATGVAPVYTSSIQGGTVSNTPTKVANGSIGAASSTISFGSVGNLQSKTVYLDIYNTSADLGGTLTNLTIEGYSIAGGSTGSFSVSSLSSPRTIAEGGFIVVPITVFGNPGVGALSSNLTIFTDESVGLGGVGDTFTYALSAYSVPEPASVLALGAGLAGLASVRRRRVRRDGQAGTR